MITARDTEGAKTPVGGDTQQLRRQFLVSSNDKGAGSLERIISKREAADHFKVHPKTIERWCRRGILEKVKVPGSRIVRFRTSQVALLICNSRVGVTRPRSLDRKKVF
jgi:hypothetical protein